MTSGPSGKSGKNTTPRRQVGCQHWPLIDRAAIRLGDGSGASLVRRLLEETITDATTALETCRRIHAAVSKDRRSET